jgi:hypothetical protein
MEAFMIDFDLMPWIRSAQGGYFKVFTQEGRQLPSVECQRRFINRKQKYSSLVKVYLSPRAPIRRRPKAGSPYDLSW